jgi:hypothetical protein
VAAHTPDAPYDVGFADVESPTSEATWQVTVRVSADAPARNATLSLETGGGLDLADSTSSPTEPVSLNLSANETWTAAYEVAFSDGDEGWLKAEVSSGGEDVTYDDHRYLQVTEDGGELRASRTGALPGNAPTGVDPPSPGPVDPAPTPSQADVEGGVDVDDDWNHDAHQNASQGVGPQATASVEGKVVFYNVAKDDHIPDSSENAFLGMNSALVKVFDEDPFNPDDKVGSTCTDDTGDFRVEDVGTGSDVYIETSTSIDCGGTKLVDENNRLYRWDSNEDSDESTCETGVNEDVGSGTFDIGTCEAPNDQRDWWTIWDQPQASHDMVDAEGYDPGTSVLSVPNSDHDGAEYHVSSEIIHIPGRDYRDAPDVQAHEYGHHLMDDVYSGIPGDCPSPHYIDEDSNENCAWTEGWATYIAVETFAGGDRWADDTWTYDFSSDDEDDVREYDLEENPKLGDPNEPDEGLDVEGAVAGTLVDVSDDRDNEDTHENVDDQSFSDIWEVFVESEVDDTFDEYETGWDSRKAPLYLTTAACDNTITDFDQTPPAASVDTPTYPQIADYEVSWSGSDQGCGVDRMELYEDAPGGGDNFQQVCSSQGDSGSCSRNPSQTGDWCYKSKAYDENGNTDMSRAKCVTNSG